MHSSPVENNVHILLAVWGEKFITDFLQFGLLSLLAPGNVPAMAKAYKTTFVFLTRADDVEVFMQDPSFQKLKTICDIQFIAVDELIVMGNHSTTITFAYDKAIRQAGQGMLNTYFVFLTADYIMADGSFEGLIRYMKKGYSGIYAGNFQVIESDIKPFLQGYIDTVDCVMQIQPRELLKESFKFFHSITLASLYEERHLHNDLVNRFFLRYDKNTLLGRFYLLHMLCIKPETVDYQVGASCDYSFIPEMCPSGNVAIINDSDDYLVIEMQSKDHELNNVQLGPYDFKKLVRMLAEWTTARHRENVKQAIFYHTGDLSPETKEKIKIQSDQFIDVLTRGLQNYKVQPYRNHPYWIGAVNVFNETRAIIKKSNSSHSFDLPFLIQSKKNINFVNRFMGSPPSVNRWHYRWLEYQLTKGVMQKFVLSHNPDRILTLYQSNEPEFMGYCRWLKQDFKMEHHYHLHSMVNTKSIFQSLQKKQFESCLFFIRSQDLKEIKSALAIIKSILGIKGKILIFILNGHQAYPVFLHDFKQDFASRISELNDYDYRVADIILVKNNLSLLGSFMSRWINKRFEHSKRLRLFLYFLIGLSSSFFVFIRNCFSRKFISEKDFCTSMFVMLSDEGLSGDRS